MTHPFGLPDQSDRRYRLLIAAAALVIVAAGIRQAASLLDSLLLAILLTVTVLPAFDVLRRRGASQGAAVVLTVLLLVGVAVALLGFLGVAASRLADVLPRYGDRAEALRQGLERWMIARGIDPERVFSRDLVDPGQLLNLAAGFLSQIGALVSGTLLLILIVAYILLARGASGKALQPGGTLAVAAREVRQYLLITSGSAISLAVVVYVLMRAVGTDLAFVWAVLAFVMSYVPNVGIILSLVPPVILTLLEFGWERALVILAGYLVLNSILDDVIVPRFTQSRLDLPPLVSLISLLVWTYLLGPPGALLAVPLTIVARRVLGDAGVPPAATSGTADDPL
jgi:predicted PurR-regulated permease PerM